MQSVVNTAEQKIDSLGSKVTEYSQDYSKLQVGRRGEEGDRGFNGGGGACGKKGLVWEIGGRKGKDRMGEAGWWKRGRKGEGERRGGGGEGERTAWGERR